MRLLLLTAALIVGGLAAVSAQNLPAEEDVANATYMGSNACRACHMSAAQGEMYKIWENSEHAKAYETLATDEAKAIAAGLDIANPQEDETCLKCHSTIGGVPSSRVHARFNVSEGVGCESCHGAGQFYRTKRVMCGILTGTIEGARVGLIKPNADVCARCHAGTMPAGHPAHDFTYETAVQEIAHPLPASRAEGQGCNR